MAWLSDRQNHVIGFGSSDAAQGLHDLEDNI